MNLSSASANPAAPHELNPGKVVDLPRRFFPSPGSGGAEVCIFICPPVLGRVCGGDSAEQAGSVSGFLSWTRSGLQKSELRQVF